MMKYENFKKLLILIHRKHLPFFYSIEHIIDLHCSGLVNLSWVEIVFIGGFLRFY